MNYDGPKVDPVDDWLEIRRGYALQHLNDARAAVRQVSATALHNPSPEWLNELERCRKALEVAEKDLAQLNFERKNDQ